LLSLFSKQNRMKWRYTIYHLGIGRKVFEKLEKTYFIAFFLSLITC